MGDFSTMDAAGLKRVFRLNRDLAGILIARLRVEHPRRLNEFWPQHSPVPDTEYLSTFDTETRTDVMAISEYVATAMRAMEILENRRRAN